MRWRVSDRADPIGVALADRHYNRQKPGSAALQDRLRVGGIMHKNPFNGKCIHGKDGATVQKGRLFNPSCDKCKEQA